MRKVQEIEQAIGKLTAQEVEELRQWLEACTAEASQPIDERIAQDLAAGKLDRALDEALEEEKLGRTEPL